MRSSVVISNDEGNAHGCMSGNFNNEMKKKIIKPIKDLSKERLKFR